LDRTPVHYASVALHPEMKFEYLEQEWEDRPDWIERAKSETKRLWERDYKGSGVRPAPRASPGARENDLLNAIEISSSPSLPSSLQATFTDRLALGEPAWQKKKRARLTRSQVDPLERSQQLPVENFAGMQDYWVKALDTGVAGLLGRDLPRMGVELNTIAAMSTEAECIFSGYVHCIPVILPGYMANCGWSRSIHTPLPISELPLGTISLKQSNV
jgi:hypothetical protein